MENFKNKPNLHFFNPELAECYGVHEAIMLNHLIYWIAYNSMTGKNYHEGRFWTFNPIREFAIQLPYFNENKITRIIKSLINQGVIITGNYNKHRYDQTRWYALKNEQHFLTKYNPIDKFRECKRKF